MEEQGEEQEEEEEQEEREEEDDHHLGGGPGLLQHLHRHRVAVHRPVHRLEALQQHGAPPFHQHPEEGVGREEGGGRRVMERGGWRRVMGGRRREEELTEYRCKGA